MHLATTNAACEEMQRHYVMMQAGEHTNLELCHRGRFCHDTTNCKYVHAMEQQHRYWEEVEDIAMRAGL